MRADVPGTVEEVYRDLLARAPENKMQPRLEPMRRVLALLGDPQHAAPVIHLTGTNGKTSTARMVEAVLRAYGLRTGRYTSPHLQRVTERISIDGAPVSDETFVRVWGEILPIVQAVDAELEAEGKLCFDGPGRGAPALRDGQYVIRFHGVAPWSCAEKKLGGFAQAVDPVGLVALGTRAFARCCARGGAQKEGGVYAAPDLGGPSWRIWCGTRNGTYGIASLYPTHEQPTCGD